MSRASRAAIFILIGAAIMALILAILFFALTRTRAGVNLVGRFAIERVEREIEGRLQVDSITTRALLGGVVLHGVSITDLEGRPFIEADSIRLGYRLRSFLAGEIVFDRVTLHRPLAVIEQLPGDSLWNFEHIFPSGPPEPDKERSLIEIDRIRVVDGTAIVRTPIEPESPGGNDHDRLIIREVPGGLLREVRFDQINATIPRLIWETPHEPGRLIEVAALSLRGLVWEDPFFVESLRGAVTIRDSLITFDVPSFQMPESRGSAIGEIVTGERLDYDISVQADHIAFADLRWLYPPLAVEGGGSANFRMQSQPVGTLFLVRDAELTAPGTNLTGTFGIVVDDTLYFTEVDLRASPLNLGLLHEIIPDAPVLEGLLIGTIEVEGPISSLLTSGELTLADDGSTGREARVRWNGTIDLDEPYGATALSIEIAEFDLAILEQLMPETPLGGILSGHLEATGELDRGLNLRTELRHAGVQGGESRLLGKGTMIQRAGRPHLDLFLDAEPFDFRGLASILPALGQFEGEARGTIMARGEPDELEIAADLLAEGGRLQLHGHLGIDGASPTYQLEGALDDILVDHLLAGRVPRETSLNARFKASGAGIDPRTARAELHLQVDSARFASIDLSSANLGLRIEDGIALLDSLVVNAAIGALRASGTLGLDSMRSGTIGLIVNADSLVALQSILFPDAPALLDPDSVRGRLDGSARIEAELRGALGALEVDGSARIRRPAVDGASAHQAHVVFKASDVGNEALLAYDLTTTIDSLDLYGHRLDRATAHLEFNHGGGWFQFEASAREPEPTEYHLISGFRPLPDGVELGLRELRAHAGDEEWGLAEPALLRIGADGLQVENLLFSRTTGAGRVLANGTLPWGTESDSAEVLLGDGIADLRIVFQQLPLLSHRPDEVRSAFGVADITGTAIVTGSAFDPRIDIDIALNDTHISGLHFERIIAALDYYDQRLEANFEISQDGNNVLIGTGLVPIDLRFIPIPERRLDEPLDLTVRANGIPAAVLESFIEGFRAIEGQIDGLIALGGTTLNPVLGGQVSIRDGAATSIDSGVRYRGVAGIARVRDEQVVELDFTARTTGGSATIGGTVDFENLVDPTFDLLILARNFQAVHRRDVEMTASGEVRLEGTFNRPHITGRVRVDRGTLYLDEVWRQYQIVTLDDPLLFDMMDTTFVLEEQIFNEAQTEFVKNMKVDAEVEIGRGSWIRSRELNVEGSGSLRVEFNRSTEDIRLTGTLNAVRGTYELYVAEDLPARRFVVRGGTVEFDGTPGMNPRFDITASYRVRTTDRQPLNVIATVTGNLENPRVNLRSDDDETIGESDLLSYLIFGRPTHALAGGETRQLDSYLTGLGAGLMTPTVLGYWAMLSETIATNLGIADYVSITPAEADTIAAGNSGLLDFVDPFSALGRAQVEVGNYLGDHWYMAVTRRFGHGVKPYDFGVRFEWRLAPTWTAEFFVEDRFARLGRFGFDQPLESRKVGGLFLFREWGF